MPGDGRGRSPRVRPGYGREPGVVAEAIEEGLHGRVGIEPHLGRVGADERAGENPAGKTRRVAAFERLERGDRDLGVIGDLPERDPAPLARLTQRGPEIRHDRRQRAAAPPWNAARRSPTSLRSDIASASSVASLCRSANRPDRGEPRRPGRRDAANLIGGYAANRQHRNRGRAGGPLERLRAQPRGAGRLAGRREDRSQNQVIHTGAGGTDGFDSS